MGDHIVQLMHLLHSAMLCFNQFQFLNRCNQSQFHNLQFLLHCQQCLLRFPPSLANTTTSDSSTNIPYCEPSSAIISIISSTTNDDGTRSTTSGWSSDSMVLSHEYSKYRFVARNLLGKRECCGMQ